MSAMTKGEREDLQRLIRQREKALKSAARQRSSDLIAEFENALGAQFSFDNDQTWAEVAKLAKQEMERANARVAARAAELGVPKTFAPSLEHYWLNRGENASKERRVELRKMATTRNRGHRGESDH